MFGNHPLPNIGPSHPFHPPPPSHHPIWCCQPCHPPHECPIGPSEGIVINTHHHITATNYPAHHVTTTDHPACHITCLNELYMPHHCLWWARLLYHHPWRPLHAMSPPLTAANGSEQLPLPSLRDVHRCQNQPVGVRGMGKGIRRAGEEVGVRVAGWHNRGSVHPTCCPYIPLSLTPQ